MLQNVATRSGDTALLLPALTPAIVWHGRRPADGWALSLPPDLADRGGRNRPPCADAALCNLTTDDAVAGAKLRAHVVHSR